MRRSPDPRDLLPLTPAVLHILLALADGRRASESEESVSLSGGRHGYAVAQEVEEMTEGQIRMGPGTLYGSIQRMLTSGLIDEVARGKSATRTQATGTDEDERRRYYRLSPLGRRVLQLELARLARVVVVARAKHLLTDPELA
ncbi:MAG TPA: PadR family transcriptional regulator [Gemmatimonadaceae bacterium]